MMSGRPALGATSKIADVSMFKGRSVQGSR